MAQLSRQTYGHILTARPRTKLANEYDPNALHDLLHAFLKDPFIHAQILRGPQLQLPLVLVDLPLVLVKLPQQNYELVKAIIAQKSWKPIFEPQVVRSVPIGIQSFGGFRA